MTSPLLRAMLVALAVCALPEAALAQAPTDIGTLPGFTRSRPKNINSRGLIVGQVARPGPDEQAALWTRTSGGYTVEALPALDGLTRSDARAFARGNVPVGFSSLIGGGISQFRAVVWRDDPSGLRVAVELEPPPGFLDAQAFDANRFGMVVGEAVNSLEIVGGLALRHAVAWVPKPDGEYDVLDLGVPDGFSVSSASGVNDGGEIVGTARRLEVDGSQTWAVVVWRRPFKRHGRCHSDTLVLPSHPDLPLNQNPTISSTGFVVAQADREMPGAPRVTRPLLWRRWGRGFAGPYELPVPAGFTDAFPSDVGETGVIVGTAQVRQATAPTLVASQAVVWSWARRGGFRPMLLASPAGSALVTASRLNERGDVVGTALDPAAGTSGGLIWKRAASGRWCPPTRHLEPRTQEP